MANGNGNGCSCANEVWDCQGGPVAVPVDARGCPLEPQYCKQQAGAFATVAAGAAFAITIAVGNLVSAKVRSFFMEASDPAAPVAASPPGSLLQNVGVTGITILGNQVITGEVPATRYAHDTEGPGGCGIQQSYRGNLGTAGGVVLVTGVNRSAVPLTIWAAVDIDGVKAL